MDEGRAALLALGKRHTIPTSTCTALSVGAHALRTTGGVVVGVGLGREGYCEVVPRALLRLSMRSPIFKLSPSPLGQPHQPTPLARDGASTLDGSPE